MVSRSAPAKQDTIVVSVTLPQQVLEFLDMSPKEAAAYLGTLALIELFRRGEVSSGWAAEKLGISKWDFITLLGEHKVPYIDLTEEELRQEVEAALSHRGRQGRPPPTADR